MPEKIEDKQPRVGSHTMDIQTLGIMPSDVIGPNTTTKQKGLNSKDPLEQPKGKKVSVSPVKVGQYSYDTSPEVFNRH
jgi:hypothetical protein